MMKEEEVLTDERPITVPGGAGVGVGARACRWHIVRWCDACSRSLAMQTAYRLTA